MPWWWFVLPEHSLVFNLLRMCNKQLLKLVHFFHFYTIILKIQGAFSETQ